MKQLEKLRALREALAEAHDYVSAYLATGGHVTSGEVIPFNPRAEVFNQLRDALREVTFRHERAPAAEAAAESSVDGVVALSTSGLALIDTPAGEAA